MGLLDFLLLLIVNCLSPYIGMSSVSDYKVRGWVRVGGAWRVGGEGEMILSVSWNFIVLDKKMFTHELYYSNLSMHFIKLFIVMSKR